MIIDIIKNKNEIIRYILILFVLAVFVGLYFTIPESRIVFLILIFTNLLATILSFDKIRYGKIGELKISDDKIVVEINGTEKETFNLNELMGIRINHKSFLNRKILIKAENKIKFTFINDEREKCLNLYIKGSQRRNQLKDLIEGMYRKSIKIIEFDENGGRSFLFKSNLSYKEIQNIKQKYNMSWY